MATAKTHPDNDPIAGEEHAGEMFWYFQCTSPQCNVRFPAPDIKDIVCPFCKSTLEKTIPADNFRPNHPIAHRDAKNFAILLENLRSAYNVGSILRTADGAGIKHAYLCGITPTPLNSRLAKTALSAEIYTPWSHHPNAIELIDSLKKSGQTILGLEITETSKDIFLDYSPPQENTVLVVGNEICGIDPAVLKECDSVYAIPMVGKKDSLNVAVSFGIAIYQLLFNKTTYPPVQ